MISPTKTATSNANIAGKNCIFATQPNHMFNGHMPKKSAVTAIKKNVANTMRIMRRRLFLFFISQVGYFVVFEHIPQYSQCLLTDYQ